MKGNAKNIIRNPKLKNKARSPQNNVYISNTNNNDFRYHFYQNQRQYDPDYNTVYSFKPVLDNDMARQRKLNYLMENYKYNQRPGDSNKVKVTILSNRPRKIIKIRQDDYYNYNDNLVKRGYSHNVKSNYIYKNEEPLRNQINYNNRCICGLGEVVYDDY